jgi:cytochrome c oxidase subunit 4
MASDTHHPQHPSIGQYWKIAGILALITAIEVALFYIDRQLELGILNNMMLIVLSAMKFVVVVGWYMHLRFERPLLNRFFVAGFILALGVYGVVLAAMGIIVIRGA